MAIYKRLRNFKLQDWYGVEITLDEDTKYVRFHSRIHKNMPTDITHWFSSGFSDNEILNDRGVMTKFIEHFGADSFI